MVPGAADRTEVASQPLSPFLRQRLRNQPCGRVWGPANRYRMTHNVPLIATIAAAFGAALLLGFVAVRVRLPAIVGYLLAGILIGPYTPGLVADSEIAGELAEIGVMLLMFGVGLHFSLGDLLSVKRIAVPGAILQIVVATALGAVVAHAWGWTWGGSIVFGLSLSVASTVVLLRALEARGLLASMNGRIAVGWLIVEDLAMVLALVMLPALANALEGGAQSGADVALALGKTLLQVAAFMAVMLVAGKRVLPRLLAQISHTGSRELFTLTVVAVAVGIAFMAAKLFGVSFALGAFFAGMVLRESEFSHRAAEESLPLRDAFAVLFFVSVGMLFNPWYLVEHPIIVAATLAIVILGKPLAAVADSDGDCRTLVEAVDQRRQRFDGILPGRPGPIAIRVQAHLMSVRRQAAGEAISRMPWLPSDSLGLETRAQNGKASDRTGGRLRLDHAARSCLHP